VFGSGWHPGILLIKNKSTIQKNEFFIHLELGLLPCKNYLSAINQSSYWFPHSTISNNHFKKQTWLHAMTCLTSIFLS
jgi:hypothetical protein